MPVAAILSYVLTRTVTTASWRDGTKGPLYIVVGQDDATARASQEAIRQVTQDWSNQQFEVVVSGREKHFFDAKQVMHYLNSCVSKAFRSKREEGAMFPVSIIVTAHVFGAALPRHLAFHKHVQRDDSLGLAYLQDLSAVMIALVFATGDSPC